ncbi:MAG: RNA polymerase sigma factor, partial [Actinobacteria bacterium]|nr:RNA polymerase sigma factor [Actinomycetota bacterium]
FDRHVAAIHRSLARRVGRQLADDLAAETFVEAFRSRGRYDVRYPDARPWLHGIATNVLRHHHRRERRRLIAYARTGVDPVLSDQSELADARADADALGPRIALALASLRPRDRDTLLLFAWEQLSYEEVARALGVPVGTVRSRLHRARRMVRELIGDPGQYLTDENVPRAEGGSSGG